MTRQELYDEIGCLNGSVNLMCVTDDIKELESMKEKAVKQIQKLYEENLKRINNDGEKLVEKCK